MEEGRIIEIHTLASTLGLANQPNNLIGLPSILYRYIFYLLLSQFCYPVFSKLPYTVASHTHSPMTTMEFLDEIIFVFSHSSPIWCG